MSLGPVMLDIAGTALTEEDKTLLLSPAVGGVILFTRNFKDIDQLTQLVTDIHALRDPHLLIAVDHEGGRVQRFKEGFTLLPAMARIGELYDLHPKQAKDLAQQLGWLMAIELRSIGIDFSFAPVVDINYQQCAVIGDRSLHRKPQVVYELAHAYIKGMDDAGMAAVAKHFPGHGYVSEDSHVAIPVDERHFDRIYDKDIYPFRMLIQENIGGIMPAHVIYTNIDPHPAGFSSFWLKQVLREKLSFSGVIFSDDLDMQGASVVGDSYAKRAATALQAGCDMVLVCNNREGAKEVVDSLSDWADPVINTRLARMHGRKNITRQALHGMAKWHEVTKRIQQYTDNPTLDLNF